MSRFFFLICISLIISCSYQDNKTNHSAANVSSQAKPDAEQPSPEVCDTSVIVKADYTFKNDELISTILNESLTARWIDSSFNGVERTYKISNNQYEPSQSDTTCSYKIDCDSVSYLSSKANSFPLYVSVQSGRVKFFNNRIETGMPKNQFAAMFGLHANFNIIRVTETENANQLFFVFANNKLTRVVYQNLYAE